MWSVLARLMTGEMPMRPGLIAALMIGLATPAAALDLGNMSAAEQDDFRAAVRSYLIENPEVLMEAIAVLDQRQAEAAARNDATLAQFNREALFNDGYSWVGGNPDGDVTLVEFLDYRCGYCRRAHDEVAELVNGDGNIRFIIKELPILGEQSTLSSQFAIAVKQLHGDAAYFEVHEALMSMRNDATAESLTRLATAFDIDPAPVMARMTSPEVAAEIATTRSLADTLKITGTPTFVLQDQMLRGYVPLDQMQQIVAQLRGN
jgi:protein-disulfide isomerase